MIEKLTSIQGIAVPLLWDNVDTDALVPAAPHKKISGGGRDRLGRSSSTSSVSTLMVRRSRTLL